MYLFGGGGFRVVFLITLLGTQMYRLIKKIIGRSLNNVKFVFKVKGSVPYPTKQHSDSLEFSYISGVVGPGPSLVMASFSCRPILYGLGR